MAANPGVPCSAHRRDGQPCKRYAILGGSVCPSHGGSAGQVKVAARQRWERAQAAARNRDEFETHWKSCLETARTLGLVQVVDDEEGT